MRSTTKRLLACATSLLLNVCPSMAREDAFRDRNDGRTAGLRKLQQAADAAAVGCQPSDITGFDCSLSLLDNKMFVHWTTPDGTDTGVNFAVKSTGSGYVSLGWADAASPRDMQGTVAVIGYMGEGTTSDGAMGTVEVYDLNGYSASDVVLSSGNTFTISDTSIERDGSGTTMYFTRPLDDTFTASSELPYHTAYSTDSDSFVYHGNFVTSFNLGLNGQEPTGVQENVSSLPRESLYQAHAWLMVLGWAALIPFGVLFARRLAWIGPAWLHIHRAANTIGLLAATAGIIIAAVKFGDGSGGDYNRHKIIGIIVLVLGWLQAIAGMVRPKPPAKGEKATSKRTAWAWYHRIAGYVSIGLAQYVIYLGIQLYDADYPISDAWRDGFLAWLVLLGGVLVLLELPRLCQPDKKGNSQVVGDDGDNQYLSKA